MSELGDLLEVIHNAHGQVATFKALYDDVLTP